MSQLTLFFRLYFSPLKSFSRILDEGRLIFAALAAIAVLLLVQLPRAAEQQREEAKAMMRNVQARVEKAAAKAGQNGTPAGDEAAEGMRDAYADMMASVRGPLTVRAAVDRFTGENPASYFSPLIAMAVCFVPMVILVLTFWDNLGGFSTILFRDYMALLVCCLLAWTAPYLLLMIVNGLFGALHLPAYRHPPVWWAANAYFLVLAALAVRTLFGATFVHAAGATGGAWLSAVGGIWIYGSFGSVTGYLASPFVLYYLYLGLGPQLSGLGGGLRSRQRLKQGLEIATLNPNDADAHYQLGLIYMQRRQYESATDGFRKAVKIAPNEPDAHYQLGRIMREQGHFAEAVEHCRAAARCDDKHSSHEVWREIGIASLLGGDSETARQALEKYMDRRPYDPEGGCWYGRTLAALGRCEQARSAFDQAIEAVRTMPPARRRQVGRWLSEAQRERKKLPCAG